MGLAPYGKPRYAQLIKEKLIDIEPDGSFRLDLRYFEYLRGQVMTGRGFERLFGGPWRTPEGPLIEREFDLAALVQQVTEEVVVLLARHARELTGERHLVLAGGVAPTASPTERSSTSRSSTRSGFSPPRATPGARSGRPSPLPRTSARPGHTWAPAATACPVHCSDRSSAMRRSPPTWTAGGFRTPVWIRKSSADGSPKGSPTAGSSAGSRGGWSAGPGRSGPGRSSETRGIRPCSPP